MEPCVIKFTLSKDERVRLKKAALDAGHLRTGDFIRSLIRNAIPAETKTSPGDREKVT